MADDNTDSTTTPDTAPAPRSTAPSGDAALDRLRAENDLNNIRQSLRAVSQERNGLKERLAAMEAELETLRPFKAKAEEVEQQFNAFKQESGHQLSLAELGITSQRARRALLREYKDDTAEMEEKPTLTEWANTVRDDPFFSRFFPATEPATEPETEDKPAAPRRERPPAKGADGDPNGGTKGGGGGSGGAKQMDADEWRRERAKQGGRIKGDALQQQLDALRAQGVIS